MVFALSKEDGVWKIDNIGGAELEEIEDISSSAVKDPPPQQQAPTPEPWLELPSPSPRGASSTSARASISAGVLNGKATSLPKPAYPAVAKAAKASGTVVVQVTVDENGNVTDASPVSGHPLLRAAAVSAARNAKFTPTKLSGQPVKVTGVITYNFVAE
jgi:TonB family protein